jgi:hypothetical protein
VQSNVLRGRREAGMRITWPSHCIDRFATRLSAPSHHLFRQLLITFPTLLSQGRYEEALPLCREALRYREEQLGDDHPNALASANNLAAVLKAQGQLADAAPLATRALSGCEAALGPDHPGTLACAVSMADLLHRQGKLSEAEPLVARAVAGYEAALGEGDVRVLMLVCQLSMVLADSGDARADEAAALFARVRDGYGAVCGARLPLRVSADNLTAGVLLAHMLHAQVRACKGRGSPVGICSRSRTTTSACSHAKPPTCAYYTHLLVRRPGSTRPPRCTALLLSATPSRWAPTTRTRSALLDC